MIRLVVNIPDLRTPGLAGARLEAAAEPAGYRVTEACCMGWHRGRDGALSIDIVAKVRSPPGLVEALP